MDEKRIREIIETKLEDGALSCDAAHRIAEAIGVHLTTIGKICNEEGDRIKIKKCLLGCF